MSQAPAIKARQGQGFRMDNDIRCPDDPVRAVLLSTVADHAVKDADGRDVGERCPIRGDELGDVSLEETPGFRVRLVGRQSELRHHLAIVQLGDAKEEREKRPCRCFFRSISIYIKYIFCPPCNV